MDILNAGKRGHNPTGVVIHNDAGSNGANVAFYNGWLPNHNPENGFAHVYIASDGRLQASDFSNKAWHCANSYGNANYASWEVCQSEGELNQFLKNEQAVLDDVAKYMKQWGLKPSKDTVKLHRELSATSCPRRSVEAHGGTLESCRTYFINELNKRLSGNTSNGTNENIIEKGNTDVHIFVETVDTKNFYEVINGYYTRVLDPGMLKNMRDVFPGIKTLPLFQEQLEKVYKPLK